MRIHLAWLFLCAPALLAQRVDIEGELPVRTPLAVDSAEVQDALRYVMTEVRRLSNRYRYATLKDVYEVERGPANFDGHNLFLELELDMLNNKQPSRHEVILFHDEFGVTTGMALDEFPETLLRGRPDPDV